MYGMGYLCYSIQKLTGTPLETGGRLSDLGIQVWNNLPYHRDIPYGADMGDYYLGFQIPYLREGINNSTNWKNYFGHGLYNFEAFNLLEVDSRKGQRIVSDCRKGFLKKYGEIYPSLVDFIDLLRKMNSDDFLSSNWDLFWEKWNQIAQKATIFQAIFFEIFKQYIILYSDDPEAVRLNALGEPCLKNYYEILFDIDPGFKINFDNSRFNPEISLLENKLSAKVSGLIKDPLHFKRFIVESMETIIEGMFFREIPCLLLLFPGMNGQQPTRILWD